ncbi:hypothetical protein J4P02_01545 [Pseudomonas sp. NFXW11]|uniref:DUF6603 domain-containing protein n=1 Tax=Pseudomonas sp. NFXW11 TaxID=2819531 RepID=UPI003CED9AC4
MATPSKLTTAAQTSIASVEVSPVIVPGTLFFGLYDDQGLKVKGGFKVEDLVLSRHMPLVSQDFADTAVVLKDFQLAFEHAFGGSGDSDQFVLELELVLGGNSISRLKLPLSGSSNPPPLTALAPPSGSNARLASADQGAAPQNVPQGSIFWINIQKSIGPIHIGRIGFNSIGDDVQVLLDAGLATSSFSIELSGLSATVPIFGLGSFDDIQMGLKGLDVAFSTAALSIEGGLLISEQNGRPEYDGALQLRTADLALMALGSFTSIASNGHTDNSLFGFAFLDHAIGGPPAFFVTGLSAGFGYNRSVQVPSIAEVGSFPLLAGLSDPSQLGLSGSGLPAASQLEKVLEKVNRYIQPELGEYWFAAGIQFTSFELIHSNVVAVLEVGKEFEILVLGKSYGSFPPTGVTYGYVELDLEVVFQPDAGLFKAEAALSPNSYVLDQNCHLTGGFAFYSWFGDNPHAGDFVFTVGGYHPAFKQPDYYPVVARLGFNWPVSSEVLIKGGAYFALTPSCIMAGGSLEAVYQSGNLRAWFTAYADLLIYWKPFYFTAGIGVDVGVSYHVHFLFVSTTLHFELGATVALHGPPTGGIVHIHLWIISFSVPFGASDSAGEQKLGWDDFKAMLAQPRQSAALSLKAQEQNTASQAELCHLTISNGLLNQVQDSDGSVRWLVRADEFVFDATSAVPITQLSVAGSTLHSQAGALAIRPMRVGSISSSLASLSIVSEDGNPITWNTPQPFNRALPQALWGAPVEQPSKVDPNAKLIDDCLVGVRGLSALATYQPAHTGPIDILKAFTYFTLYPEGSKTLPWLPISASAAVVANSAAIIADARGAVINPAIAKTASARGQIVSALNALCGFALLDEAMSGFDAQSNFASDPLIGPLPLAQVE